MINGKKIAAIVQARQGSSRLSGKATIDICGKPALQRVIERLRQAKTLDEVIVATTINEADDAIVELCEALHCNCYRGSEEDVLSRVLEAAKLYEVDLIVEITADCVCVDWNIVDELIRRYSGSHCDYYSNVLERTFPRGFDCQVFSTAALEMVNREVDNGLDREHVSSWMYLNPKSVNYVCLNWNAPPELCRPDIQVVLDTPEDLELIRWIFGFEGQGYRVDLTCQNVINLLDTYPHMLEKVKRIKRKDYFAELEEAYKNKPAEKQEGSEKKDGAKVERVNNRGRKPGSVKRPAGKSKSK